MEKLYTPIEVSEMFKVTVQTIYRWAKEKKLKAVVVGDSLRFSESDINTFIREYEKNES